MLERHGIAVRVDLPGVGRNLQDRYEIGVVNRMAQPWRVLDGARFRHATTGCSANGRVDRTGMYVSNGAALAVSLRSQPRSAGAGPVLHGAAGEIRGIFPRLFARSSPTHHDYLTWAVLKAHTNNRAGEVTLRSADPRDTPLVNFRYFEEGSDTRGR